MRKKFLIILILPVLFCSCSFYEPTFPEVVAINFFSTGIKTSGYGVVFEDAILTVAHIFGDKYEKNAVCTIIHTNGISYQSELIFIDYTSDLALVSNKAGGKNPSLTASRSALYVYCDDKYIKTDSSSRVKCVLPRKPEVLLKLNASVEYGASGSPVINGKGDLAGIICAKSPDGKYAYAVPADVIEEFTDKYRYSTK